MAERRREDKNNGKASPSVRSKSSEQESFIVIRVVPRSSKIVITQEQANSFRIRLTAPPVDGAANAQLLKVLSERLALPARNIQLIAGETGRLKRLRILGLDVEEIARRLTKS